VVVYAHYFATMFTCAQHLRISNIYIYINRSGTDLILFSSNSPQELTVCMPSSSSKDSVPIQQQTTGEERAGEIWLCAGDEKIS